jgi:hypothetical protein
MKEGNPRKILMFYWQNCPNASLMMPAIFGLNFSKRYSIELHNTNTPEGAKAQEAHKALIKRDTGMDNPSPTFVDPVAKKAKFINDFETLMEWLEGPEWWKKL